MERTAVESSESFTTVTDDSRSFGFDWSLNTAGNVNEGATSKEQDQDLLDFVKKADEFMRQRPHRKRPVTPEQMERDRLRKRVSRQRRRELVNAVRSLTSGDQEVQTESNGSVASDVRFGKAASGKLSCSASAGELTAEQLDSQERRRESDRLRKRMERFRKRVGRLCEQDLFVPASLAASDTVTTPSSADTYALPPPVSRTAESGICSSSDISKEPSALLLPMAADVVSVGSVMREEVPAVRRRAPIRRSQMPAEKLAALREADKERKRRQRQKDAALREAESRRKRQYRARKKEEKLGLVESSEDAQVHEKEYVLQEGGGARCSITEGAPLLLQDLLPLPPSVDT